MKQQVYIVAIIFLYTVNGFCNNAIDSLENKLQNITDVEARLSTLETIAGIYFNTDFNKFVVVARQGVEEAEKANSEKWIPVYHEMLGRGYANTSVLDSAQFFFDKAVIGYKKIDNQRGVATTYFKLGWLGRATANFDSAMEYDLKALRIMEDLKDYIGISSAYSRLAETLYYQDKPEESLKYAIKSIELGKKHDIGLELFFSYSAAADAYLLIGKTASDEAENLPEKATKYFEKSLEMYNKAFDYAKEIGLGEVEFVNLVNKQGNANKKLGRYDIAMTKYQESFQLAQKLNYEAYFPISKANIAEIYKLQGKYKESLTVYKEIITLYDDSVNPKDKAEPYAHMSQVYEKLLDYENAHKYHKLERALTDESLSLEKDMALNELRTAFETDKKDAEIKSQSLALSNQKSVRNFILGIVGLLGAFLIYVFRNSQLRKRTNEALAETNKQLDIKNQQNEILLKEIHHRVKNNLQTISSLLSLQSNSISDPNALDAVQESRNRVASMAMIHQKLYQGENLAAIEMRDYFETIGSSIISSFGNIASEVTLEIDMSEIELDVDTAIPIGLITNELLTNSLKYAFRQKKEGKISISMEKDKNDLIQLLVKDDGINEAKGISEGGTGFGSMLVNLLTTQLGGQLEQNTTNGTATIIKFPRTRKIAI